MKKLSIRQKILIHLYEFRNYKGKYQYPLEMTQEGIAKTLHMLITHVPRELNKLINLGFIEKTKGRVMGKKKRVYVYYPTAIGVKKALKLIELLKEESVVIDREVWQFGKFIESRKTQSLLELIEALQKHEIVEQFRPTLEKKQFLHYFETLLENDRFLDRTQELQFIESWYRSNVPFLVLIGGRGYGKTAILREFIRRVKDTNIVFLQFYNNRSFHDIQTTLKNILGLNELDFEQAFLDYCANNPLFLVIDGYYLVDDKVVDFFNNLIKKDLKKAKVLISMREDTPYYNRFYEYTDVNKRVYELKIRGLDINTTAAFLERKLDTRVEQIYKLTKGNPSILKFVKEKDENALKKMGALTPEQIKLLIFLASSKE